MVTIQMANGMIEVNDGQTVSFEWKSFRFSDGLREQYTNDIEIPKTRNNIRILDCYNLLDSPNQLYGNQIKPAILTVDGRMTDCYLQVVSVNKNTITVCLYEKTFPMDIRDKNIARMFVDDENTIIAWNTNSLTAYPDFFKQYDYGMPYSSPHAQLHPIKKLDDLIPTISQACNMTIPSIRPNWYVMATCKCLCPQNHIQYVEGRMSTSSHQYSIMGGQHITNDLEFSGDLTDNDKVTFNRDCTVSMRIWIGWKSVNNGYNSPFLVNHHHYDTQTNTTVSFNLNGLEYTNDVTVGTATFNVKRNDHISFGIVNGDRFDMVSSLAEFTITDYEITEDDYYQDMQYVARLPRLVVYQYASNSYEYWHFDTSEYHLGYHRKGTSNTLHRYVQTTWSSFAWFGYYANIPEMSAADLIWGIGWLLGQKPIIENGSLSYSDAYTYRTLEDGYITNIRPSSTYFGMKNYIRYKNNDNAEPISEINNIWLENEVVLHESPFGYVKNLSVWNGIVAQYSNPDHNKETDEYTCDFEDVGFIIVQNITNMNNMQVVSPYVRDIPLDTFGLEKITSIMEVDIESFDTPTEPIDYVYLDGRKYMTIEGNFDLKTKKSVITALLVPTI